MLSNKKDESFDLVQSEKPDDQLKARDLENVYSVKSHTPRWKNVLILVLTISQLGMLRFLAGKQQCSTVSKPQSLARVEELPIQYSRFAWTSPYSSDNDTEAHVLWNAIKTDHGVIAVNSEWATQHHWPETLPLPTDPSKGVYLLGAYHQMHCVRKVREIFFKAIDEESTLTDHDMGHIRHCFDALRQAIQCNADNLPMYSFGDHTVGVGQLMQCRDWSRLREYATKNSACYQDPTEDPATRLKFVDRFGRCDGGHDGILEMDGQ